MYNKIFICLITNKDDMSTPVGCWDWRPPCDACRPPRGLCGHPVRSDGQRAEHGGLPPLLWRCAAGFWIWRLCGADRRGVAAGQHASHHHLQPWLQQPPQPPLYRAGRVQNQLLLTHQRAMAFFDFFLPRIFMNNICHLYTVRKAEPPPPPLNSTLFNCFISLMFLRY